VTVPTSRPLLVIMAKEPVAGTVKTRLQPLLSPQEAAGLYRCFLEDRLEEMGRLPGWVGRAVAYAPSSARPFFSYLCGASYRLAPQEGTGLSDRLTAVFARAFGEGFSAVSVIDSDSPDLPYETVLRAFRLLEEGSDAVFVPCLDGGYYLVGLGREAPGLFEGIPWSTPEVMAESLRAAAGLGLRTALLPVWRDIDLPEDLRAFCRPQRPSLSAAPARRTREFLEGLLGGGATRPPGRSP